MKKDKLLWSFNVESPLHLWAYFALFLVSNSFLAYVSLPLICKMCIGIVGILLPFLIASWSIYEKRRLESSGFRLFNFSFSRMNADDPAPPLWIWLFFLSFLFFTRFYKLSTLPIWPIGDEGTFSVMAMELQEKWSWNLLLGENQWEPLFTWLLALFFKVARPSLMACRLFPDLLSLVSIPVYYWAIRPFGARFSFITAWVSAFNFWSFTYSRMCVREGLLIPWEFLALGFLIRIMLSKNHILQYIFGLGLVLGSGFYVFTSWPLVVLVFGGMAVGKILQIHPEKNRWFKTVLLFILTTTLALPMVLARFSGKGFLHTQNVYQTEYFLPQFFRYLASLFWYGFHSAPWGPDWGGFLNPILGSFLLVGFMEIAHKAHIFLVALISTCFFLFLLPGALTSSFSPYRISSLLPLAVLLMAFGLKQLLKESPPSFYWITFFFLWIPSFFLDTHQYLGTYSMACRSPTYLNAYRVLENQSRQGDPIYVFSEFNMDYDDKTLNVACYPFDALQNPSLSQSRPKILALLLKIDYEGYLKKRFPEIRYEVLPSTGDQKETAQLGLFLIPCEELGDATLETWIKADRVCREINFSIKNKDPGAPWLEFADRLLVSKETFKGDPLLETLFWEKVAFLKFLSSHYYEARDAYQECLAQGVPVAHLYVNYAFCCRLMGENTKAKAALQKSRELAVP